MGAQGRLIFSLHFKPNFFKLVQFTTGLSYIFEARPPNCGFFFKKFL